MNINKKYYIFDGLCKFTLVERTSCGESPSFPENPPGSAGKIRPVRRVIRVSAIVTACVTVLLLVLFFTRPNPVLIAEKRITSITALLNMPTLKPADANDLLEKLRHSKLWEIDETSPIPPVLFVNLPGDMKELDVSTKKKAFINTLLPISLIALNEVEQEKMVLRSIIAKLNNRDDNLIFDDETLWPQAISDAEIEILEHLSRKYRTTSKEKLLARVDVLPVSLILAQGAIESSWGSSRFCLEGNNLFGIWTWGEKGITPKDREEGASHKIAVYESLLESVRAYLLMLNRLPAYAGLREMRSRTGCSLDLADGLLCYSQRRDSYINDLKQVIVSNKLQKFDTMALSAEFDTNTDEAMKLVQLDVAKNAKM
ncbi:MAG: glucosaminidase domain-containing protein [Pseudomonadota bacterium]